MRLFFTIFWIILVFVVLGIFTINAGQPVKIDLFFTLYEQVDLAIVAFVTTFIGFVFGAVLISFYLIREKKVGSNLRKQVKFLQAEVKKLENTPELIDAEIVETEEDNETKEDEKDK